MALLSNLKYSLTPDASDNNNKPTTVDQSTLKILVGLLGIFLPFILWMGLWVFPEQPQNHYPIESISHYYYTRMSSWFVVTLSLLAVILIFYKGKEKEDVWLSTAAGVFALLVVFLPTSDLASSCGVPKYAVTYIGNGTLPNNLRTTTHFVSAGLFLFILAIISIWRFPKTDTTPEFKKHRSFYRTVYIGCGIVMILAMIGIGLGFKGILLRAEWFDRTHNGFGTFVGESIAVVAFGYSWLLNAGFFTKFMVYTFGDYPKGDAPTSIKK